MLLEADAGAWSLDWSAVQQDISIHSRVCAYDRAGLGWSDAATRPRTAAVDVDEVRTLLRNEGERGPFIAVGNGFGGVVVRLWAALHPGEVSGMVLVDSTDPEFYAGADDIVAAGNLVAAESLFALWSPIGLELVALQVGGDGYAAGYPPAVTDQLIATAHRTGLCAARRDEALDAAESAAELAAAEHGLGSIPLAVLRHGRARRGLAAAGASAAPAGGAPGGARDHARPAPAGGRCHRRGRRRGACPHPRPLSAAGIRPRAASVLTVDTTAPHGDHRCSPPPPGMSGRPAGPPSTGPGSALSPADGWR